MSHAYLTADTYGTEYGKISADFVRFIWMVATSASTNFRPSQLLPTDTSAPVLDEFAGHTVTRSRSRSRSRVIY
jgi:hypothetical protein